MYDQKISLKDSIVKYFSARKSEENKSIDLLKNSPFHSEKKNSSLIKRMMESPDKIVKKVKGLFKSNTIRVKENENIFHNYSFLPSSSNTIESE